MVPLFRQEVGMGRGAVWLLCGCLAGCASAPAAAPELDGVVSVIDHECDDGAVTGVRIVATGPTVVWVHWSNKGACGVRS